MHLKQEVVVVVSSRVAKVPLHAPTPFFDWDDSLEPEVASKESQA